MRSCTVSAETGLTLFSCFTPKSGLWVGRIHSTKLQEGIFTLPSHPPATSLNRFAGFSLNLRLAVHDLTGLGGGQATAPFQVLWFYPLDQAGLRLRTEVSSSS